jgi:hypothetical protein
MATATAAELAARVDRLPMTRHIWVLVTLISLGGCFELCDLFLTAYIAPAAQGRLFHAGTARPLQRARALRGGRNRHVRLRNVRRIACRRYFSLPLRRSLRQADGLHLLVDLVLDHDRDHGVPDFGFCGRSVALYCRDRHRHRAGDDRHLCVRAGAAQPSRPRLCLQPVFAVPRGAAGGLPCLVARAQRPSNWTAGAGWC